MTSPTDCPEATSLQTFAEDNLSLAVANTSTTSDVWVLSGDDLSGTAMCRTSDGGGPDSGPARESMREHGEQP